MSTTGDTPASLPSAQRPPACLDKLPPEVARELARLLGRLLLSPPGWYERQPTPALRMICGVLGVPRSGRRAELIGRIAVAGRGRSRLNRLAAEHATTPAAIGVGRLASAMPKRELRRVLDDAGVRCWSGAAKYGLAAVIVGDRARFHSRVASAGLVEAAERSARGESPAAQQRLDLWARG